MGYYKDRQNFTPHNFNNSTLTLNGEHKCTGLKGFKVKRKNKRLETFSVDDGTAQFVEVPNEEGIIEISVLEASPTNAYLWDLLQANTYFSVSFLDTAAPDLSVSAKLCGIEGHPDMERDKDPKVVEWVLLTTYLDMKGAGYSLAS